MAERSGDAGQQVQALGNLGYVHFWLGEVEKSREWLERSITLHDLETQRDLALKYGIDPGMTNLAYLSWCLWFLGFPDDALETARQAMRIAEALGHPPTLATAKAWRATLHYLLRELDAVRKWAEATVAMASEQDNPFALGAGLFVLGWRHALQGKPDVGIAEMCRLKLYHRHTTVT